jgi:hypothetical protein
MQTVGWGSCSRLGRRAKTGFCTICVLRQRIMYVSCAVYLYAKVGQLVGKKHQAQQLRKINRVMWLACNASTQRLDVHSCT